MPQSRRSNRLGAGLTRFALSVVAVLGALCTVESTSEIDDFFAIQESAWPESTTLGTYWSGSRLTTLSQVSSSGDLFGAGAAISRDGQLAVVGSTYYLSNNNGCVHVYAAPSTPEQPWQLVTNLVPSSGSNLRLGDYVGVDGEIVVAGSPRGRLRGSDSGVAIVWRPVVAGNVFGEWSETQFAGSNTVGGDWFGEGVAVHGTTVVVGAPGYKAGGLNDAGALYVFDVSTGEPVQTQFITPSPAFAASSQFGKIVAVHGTTIVARGGNVVVVFEHDGSSWEETARLSPSDSSENVLFGYALAMDGDVLAVGARWHAEQAYRAGAAFIFHRDAGSGTWAEVASLRGQATSDEFGASVAVSGHTVMVASRSNDDTFDDMGAVYVYEPSVEGDVGSGWLQVAKVVPTDAVAGDTISAVDLVNTTMIVGASYANNNEGKAYVMEATPMEFPYASLSHGSVTSLGAGVDAGGVSMGKVVGVVGSNENLVFVVRPVNPSVPRGAWAFSHTISPPATSGAEWGKIVRVDALLPIIVVGDETSQNPNAGNAVTGSAYVYEPTTPGDLDGSWTLTSQLTPSSTVKRIGQAVAVDGDILAVGAKHHDSARGTVFIYTRAADGVAWDLADTLYDSAHHGYFGISIDISGEVLIVGASTYSNGASNVRADSPRHVGCASLVTVILTLCLCLCVVPVATAVVSVALAVSSLSCCCCGVDLMCRKAPPLCLHPLLLGNPTRLGALSRRFLTSRRRWKHALAL